MSSPPPVTLRSIAVAAYAPALFYGIGQGAVAPVVALTARQLGASIGVAGLVVAMLGVGQVAGDVPAGALAARIGEKRAMLVATGLVSVALTGCLLAAGVVQLAAAVFVIGCSNSVFNLARQTFLTEVVPVPLRARALSALGGTTRIGSFAGPLAAAPLIGVVGLGAAYVVHLVMAVAAAVVLLVVPDPERQVRVPRTSGPVGIADVIRTHARVLRTLGAVGVLIGAVRASRQVVVPLWAQKIGLDPATISVLYGLSAAVDMLLFYPAGKMMDVRGRAAVAVPSMAVLGVAHLLLPLARGTGSLLAVALLMGLGNGAGSGVVMTLGADVSPTRGRAEFFGVWRLFHDSGQAAGPLIISVTAAAAGLGAAVVTMGGVAVASAVLLGRWIPRHRNESSQ